MKKIFLRPKDRQRTSNPKKASQEYYLCSSNRILTGRRHSGDENGKTWFEDAGLEAVDESGNIVSGEISVTSVEWSEWSKESSGQGFDALNNRVIVGREHRGDENGKTRYATAIVLFNGKICMTTDRVSSSRIRESKGIWCCSDSERVMTGRHHSGDENGRTYYNYSKIFSLEPNTEPAPKDTKIVPDKRMRSESMKESNSSFLCPPNMVLTGRFHSGDENGITMYEYASLKAISADGEVIADADITVRNVKWMEYKKESTGEGYDAPYGKVIVGRRHSGDENGGTAYAIGEVFYNGHPTYIEEYDISAPKKESDGVWFKTDDSCVITARHHYGDENGTTYYGFGKIVCDEPIMSDKNIVLHVKMHSEEKYFPMNPVDYIRLSRLRRHVKGGTDYGYNKITNTFVKGDSHSSEYYDIPLEVIMKQHIPYGKYELMNLRPHDPNSFGKGEVFLQPDDNLTGDSDPNHRVPCIMYYENESENKKKKTISYWFFFGYDYAKTLGISGSHQGDWEKVTVNLNDEGRIVSANLSRHEESKTLPASELEIYHGEKDELTVYCAKGSHAFYNRAGVFGMKVPTAHDYTDNKGYDWIATDNVISLVDDDQLWKYFAGAWGEVGEWSTTTGPLGPWQKCDERSKLARKHYNPDIKSLIGENQVLLVIDYSKKVSESKKESEGGAASISNHKGTHILCTYAHSGDENGNTTYYFSSLTAIDIYGTKNTDGITVEDLKWTEWHKQSESQNFFVTTEMQDENRHSRVITGREHVGDENGKTRYQTGLLRYKGKLVKIVPYPDADMYIHESRNETVYPKDNLVIIGIKHSGDENGITTYFQGYIVADK